MAIIPIVPAVIPKSEAEIVALTKALDFSREFHLDVVDGKFVPNISWPYEPIGDVIAAKPYTDRYTLEVDLMVENPIKAAREWIKAGADMLVFHMETVDLISFIDFVEHSGNISVGISFSGETLVEAIFPYLEYVDYVQVMGIQTIGVQGQPFSERTFESIQIIKKKFPHLPVSVDGSVNKNTIVRLAKSGVDRLIVGSAIVGQENPHDAYQQLVASVNEV